MRFVLLNWSPAQVRLKEINHAFTSCWARVARLLATTLFVAAAAQIVMTAHAQTIGRHPGSNMVQLPTGVLIFPLAIPGASQQLLIPTIANWPTNLAADEAMKSALSPDGNTLAIVTAGYNDVILTNGAGIKTRFLFIYDVSGANKVSPKPMQVITQNNAFARRLLGHSDPRVRLLRCGSCSAGAVQRGPVERPDGRQALSGPALGLQDDRRSRR
jgi:hypothetical protein